ncbi:MAG: fructose-bisphosphatase class III [Lachnospiraceae bacterium]|nr:fructose-bisphosphatase class III [Lachnospiraceae bacterium]
MAIYVISDIHGEYDKFLELLGKIKLKDSDILYILGDVVDRGPHPIKVLLKLMEMPNAVMMVGNHELMAIECLKFLQREITEESINELGEEEANNLISWMQNGSETTIKEFRELDSEQRQEVIEYLRESLIYEEIAVGGKEYLLVHAGLGNYYPGKDIEDYSLKELIWDRAEYDIQYYPDKYVVTGHTPTQNIEGNPRPGYIYRKNNHIAIDCGASWPGGRLAAICLDTGEEYYSMEGS